MSWECKHLRWIKKAGRESRICRLNGSDCLPGQNKCVLKGRYTTTAQLRQTRSLKAGEQ